MLIIYTSIVHRGVLGRSRSCHTPQWLQWRTTLWVLPLVAGAVAPLLGRLALQRRVAGVRVVGVVPERAGPRAEDETPARQEGSAQQGEPAAVAAETRLHCVPVLTLVGHLALVNT